MACLSKGKLCAVIITSFIATLVAVAVVVFLIFTTSDTGDNFVRALPVSTDCGSVSGRVVKTASGGNISTYRNIPYAVPPLKELRWKPSTLLSDGEDACWLGEYEGTTNEYIECVNGSTSAGPVHGVEDCLVLSVRTPDLNGSRPVIVWIHGGGLVFGHSESPGYFQDEDYTERLDVVTVNINYRLGLMGFMTVEEFDTTGNYANYGLTDQITALKWVNANIENFGGDPNSVTILGNSGGATAVLGLISSPLANNLFHKAIALSPAPNWNTTYTKANEMFKDFVSNAGCEQSSRSQRLECMQNLDIEAVWNAGASVFKNHELALTGKVLFDFPMKYGYKNEPIGMAVIDPIVVPQAPKDLANALFIPKSKVKVIISNTAEETAILNMGYGLNTFPNTNEGWDSLDSVLKDHFANIMGLVEPFSSDANVMINDFIDDLWSSYPRGGPARTVPAGWTPQKAWNVITTDVRFTCPINNLANVMIENSNYEIYRLYINHAYPGFASFHAWDILALFGFKDPMFSSIPESDRAHVNGFKNAIQKLVKDFAYDNNAEDDWKTYPTKTKTLSNESPWYDVVDNVQLKMCRFWKEYELDQYGWQN